MTAFPLFLLTIDAGGFEVISSQTTPYSSSPIGLIKGYCPHPRVGMNPRYLSQVQRVRGKS